jgi:pimeloyl-ACP methyl ester carboxylesterase
MDASQVRHDAAVADARYLFPLLAPGVYQVYAEMDYLDNITVGNHDLPSAGCDAPGAVVKHFKSKPMAHTVTAGLRDFANLCLPPPLVLLHGTLQCYEDWNAWESAALSEGFIVFTPNYRWWEADTAWARRADQVMDQLLPDFEGLVGHMISSPQNTEASPPSWALVGYDMGGLVARVMASGPHRRDAIMETLAGIFLLGVPNSGTNLLPGVAGDALSVSAIVRRFNPQFPDFGDKNTRVYAMGGNEDWWRQRNSDGRVSLYSAFNITLVGCSPTAFGSPACIPFPALSFDSGDGHIFSYNHKELASADSVEEILKGVILSAGQAKSATRAELANDDEGIGDPGSPAGGSIWGTNARSSGTAQGSYPPGSMPIPEAAHPHHFTVSRTDGMGVVLFVSRGSGLFRVLNASGTEVASATADGEWEYYQIAPAPGEWTLEVTPGSNGVTFLATFVEDGTFGVNGYFTLDSYAPGDTVQLRLAVEGDPSGLTGTAATAQVLNPDGTEYQTVTLFDDGQHGDGGAGDGTFGGSMTAPMNPGAYSTLFELTGMYLDKDVVRLSADTLNVLPTTHLFTGTFSDAPEDRDADGRYDALLVTAQVALPSAGTYAVSGDLLDAAGEFVDHAAAFQTVSAPETLNFGLTFDLRGIFCVQFGQSFQVVNLRVLDGASLLPVDAWLSPVPTASYFSGDFECQPGIPHPTLRALRSDEGLQGQTLTVLAGGNNFKPGATLAFDSGITVGQVLWVDESLLAASVTVGPSASLGPHAATVTNPDASSDTLAGAFTVSADHPPTVAIQTPDGGTLIDPATTPSVMVSAAASDDIRVSRVDFLLSGSLMASDGDFPFTWNLAAASVPSGATTLTARAYDSRGQHADASVTLLKDPPTVTSVTGGGSPWQLKVLGKNFKSGITATLGNDPLPWTNVVFKSSTKIQIKGGKSLKAKFPQGQPVDIRLRNPDGTEVTTSYTRP